LALRTQSSSVVDDTMLIAAAPPVAAPPVAAPVAPATAPSGAPAAPAQAVSGSHGRRAGPDGEQEREPLSQRFIRSGFAISSLGGSGIPVAIPEGSDEQAAASLQGDSGETPRLVAPCMANAPVLVPVPAAWTASRLLCGMQTRRQRIATG
jgi:hypothetical protein